MNLVEFGTGLFLSKTPSEEAPQDVFSSSGYVCATVDVPTPLCVAFEDTGRVKVTVLFSILTF